MKKTSKEKIENATNNKKHLISKEYIKNNKINIAIIATIGIIILIFVFQILQIISPSKINYPTPEFHKENIDIYFSPSKESVSAVIQLINSSNKSIHCTFRSLNHIDIENAIFSKEESGVKTRIFVDSDYQGNKRIYKPYVRFSQKTDYDMMHNNYCIIDEEYIFTGSIIFNENTIEKNIHDIIIIKSKELASEYNSDFWKLYNKEITENEINQDEKIIQINNETKVSVIFCPYQNCEQGLIDELNNSKSSISFATYSFTNYKIIDIIRDKSRNKIWITGVIDKDGITNGSILLRNNKIPGVIADNFNKIRVHTKIFVIDKNVTITGSMNPSYKGVTTNNENVLVIYDKDIAEIYEEFVQYVYEFRN